jgi:hypothetical protein
VPVTTSRLQRLARGILRVEARVSRSSLRGAAGGAGGGELAGFGHPSVRDGRVTEVREAGVQVAKQMTIQFFSLSSRFRWQHRDRVNQRRSSSSATWALTGTRSM